jgi:hypothetical protein
MTKSRRMRWAGHAARMEAKRNAYILVERNHKEDQKVGGWIILK